MERKVSAKSGRVVEIITIYELRIRNVRHLLRDYAGQFSLVVLFLALPSACCLAQSISIALRDSTSALLQVDSANWNDAWIEVSGRDTSAPRLAIKDIRVTNGRRIAEILSVDSIGAIYRSRLALSFVLDNSASMFYSYDTLTQFCDSILDEQPKGLLGQAVTFDNTYRNPWELYTAEQSTFIAQSTKGEFTEDRNALSIFWHFYDTVRTEFTPLYDAIAAAVTNIDDRRPHDTVSRSDVLLVVTDGQDNASRTSIETLETLLASSHIRLFAINYRVEDEGRLPWLASQTGGEYFLAENLRQLKHILRTIGLELTREYHLRYRFPSLGPSGGEKK